MHVIFLALGLAITMAGVAMIGFAARIGTSSLGNAVIIGGTIAIVGGVIVAALSFAIQYLHRISQAVEARPLPRALPPGPFAAPPVADPPVPVAADPPLAKPDEAGRHAGNEALQPSPAMPATVELPHPATTAAEPAPGPPPPRSVAFDAIWAATPTRTAEPMTGPALAPVVPSPIVPAPTYEPPPVAPPAATPAAEAPTVKIFKSGVIEGMAYTLYTDGSIEAELAQGTMRFKSVDELRVYLGRRA